MNKLVPNRKQVLSVFNKLKKDVSKNLKIGDFHNALFYIMQASRWCYMYCIQYRDDDLEQAISEISKRIGSKTIDRPIKGRVVLVCSRMGDNCELVQQYVRGLIDNNIPSLVISLNEKIKNGYNNILKDINSSQNIDFRLLDVNKDYVKTAREIANLILEYRPEIILQHLTPWDSISLLGLCLVSGAKKINIDFNQHAFWIGSSFLDCNIVDQPMGLTIGIEKRSLNINHLRIVKYYPIVESYNEFEGFPFDTRGKIIIFSGGTIYKMIGADGLYFKLLDDILDLDSRFVVYIASSNLSMLQAQVNKLRNSERIYVSLFRKDIFQLMNHIDIYYGTYPTGGGLMSLYAAMAGKPIVNYTDKIIKNNCLSGLFYNGDKLNLGFVSKHELLDYVKKLVNPDYRIQEGALLKKNCPSRETFANDLWKVISEHDDYEAYKLPSMDYRGISDYYLNTRAISNKIDIVMLLFSSYKYKSILYFPFMLRLLIRIAVNKIRSK